MKAWNYKVKSNIQEIVKKLNSAFTPDHGFVFNMSHNKDAITFRVRKRVLFAFQIIFDNKIRVNGKLLKTATENETDVEVHFTQHFLITLWVMIYLGSGLFLITLGIVNSATVYILIGGLLLVIGIAYRIDVHKRFKRNIQKYKSLISDVLAL